MLMQLSPTHLKGLMGTCRQLRVAVHRFASTIRFNANSLLASDHDLHMLGRNHWHGLKVLELQQDVDHTQMCYLTDGQLLQLSSLKLSLPFCTATATQLADGNWPLLSHLNLSNSQLTPSAMAGIKRGNWPCLKELVLHSCKLDSLDLFHITNASWPSLELIDLFDNDLGGKHFRNLSMGIWPSLQILRAGTILESVAMPSLLAGQ